MICAAVAELCMGFLESLLAKKYLWRYSGFSLQHHQCLKPSSGFTCTGYCSSYIRQYPMAGTSLAAGLKMLGQNAGFFSDFYLTLPQKNAKLEGLLPAKTAWLLCRLLREDVQMTIEHGTLSRWQSWLKERHGNVQLVGFLGGKNPSEKDLVDIFNS